MSSLIKKLFHKQSVPVQQSSITDTHPNSPVTSPNTNNMIVNNDIADGSHQKLHLDLNQLTVGIAQSVGVQRTRNEDTLFSITSNLAAGDRFTQFGLYIIADGMGGHENGDVASNMAINEFSTYVVEGLLKPLLSGSANRFATSVQEIMQNGVQQAHYAIRKEALGSGTTLTAALILGDQMTIAHVGDSRAYRISSNGDIHLLTTDHSLVKRLEEIGQITPDEASNLPNRNVLYRALGQGDKLEPDIASYHLDQGDNIILCTDGLWGVISEHQLFEAIKSNHDIQQACQSLINLANANGGPDNISVIIISMPENN